MALPPMLWPLNSAPTQVTVNGLAKAADRGEYREVAGAVEKVKTILRAAMMPAGYPTVLGQTQEVVQKLQAAIEVTCILSNWRLRQPATTPF